MIGAIVAGIERFDDEQIVPQPGRNGKIAGDQRRWPHAAMLVTARPSAREIVCTSPLTGVATSGFRAPNRLGYLPNVAIGVFEIGRSHAPRLVRRTLKEVDASLN